MRDFGFSVTSEDNLDVRYKEQILQIVGVLGDVPVLEFAEIEILYPRDMPAGRQSSPTCVRTGNRSQRASPHDARLQEFPTGSESLPRRNTSTPSPQSRPTPQSRSVEDVEDLFQSQGPSPNSLDPRSYDKIRQSFKCPRFSGQARE